MNNRAEYLEQGIKDLKHMHAVNLASIVIANDPTLDYSKAKEKIPKGIQECLEIHVPDVHGFALYNFPEELKYFEKLASTYDAPHRPGNYMLVKADSSDLTVGKWLHSQLIAPKLKKMKYEEDVTDFHTEIVLYETIANSIIYGSGAGERAQYIARHAKVPSDEKIAANQANPIYLEALLSPEASIFRITDIGKGFDITKVKRAKVPDNFENLSPEDKLAFLKIPTGRGLIFAEEMFGKVPLVTSGKCCSVSFVAYPEAQYVSEKLKTA